MSCWKLEGGVAWGMGYLTTQNHANILMRLQFGRKLDIYYYYYYYLLEN